VCPWIPHPIQGTVKALERDLNLHNPRLVGAYQAYLIQQLINHYVRTRVYALYLVDQSSWASHHETHFDCIDRDVKRSMLCADNCCKRKSFKKHKWIVIYTQIIYQIRFWWLQCRVIESSSQYRQLQTLSFYATQSAPPRVLSLVARCPLTLASQASSL
jgi:hypothetical protein